MGEAAIRKKASERIALSNTYGGSTISNNSQGFTPAQGLLAIRAFGALERDDLEVCKSCVHAIEHEGLSIFDFAFANPSIFDGEVNGVVDMALMARADSTLDWLLAKLDADDRAYPVSFVLFLSEGMDASFVNKTDHARLEKLFGKYAISVAATDAKGVLNATSFGLFGVRAQEMLKDAARQELARKEREGLNECVLDSEPTLNRVEPASKSRRL